MPLRGANLGPGSNGSYTNVGHWWFLDAERAVFQTGQAALLALQLVVIVEIRDIGCGYGMHEATEATAAIPARHGDPASDTLP